MNEAVRGTFMIKLTMVFLIVFVGLLCVAYQYAKAFKAKNVIIDYIEKYEGYNDLSRAAINNYLSSIRYNVPLEDNEGYYASNHPDAYCDPLGYCIEFVDYGEEFVTVGNADGSSEDVSDVSADSRRVGCIVTTFIPINLFGIGDMFSIYRFKVPSLEVSSEVQVYDPYWTVDY